MMDIVCLWWEDVKENIDNILYGPYCVGVESDKDYYDL